jgi:hypothetical protein
MNEIMPYYNQLYKSELLEFNPLYNVDLASKKDGTIEKKGEKVENTNQNYTMGGSSKVDSTSTTHDDGTVTENVTNTNTGTIKQNNTSKDSGTVGNLTNVTDTGNTTNNLTDTTTATNTLEKDQSENKLDTFADTPQGAVTDLETSKYLTNARKNVNSAEDKETEKINSSLKKTGSVDSTNTTKTDSTQTNNLTNVTENTQTNNITDGKNGTTTSNIDNVSTGTVETTNSSTSTNYGGLTATDKVNDFESFVETIKGKQGGENYSELLKQFRQTFLNIDMMVIDELGELFFNLW